MLARLLFLSLLAASQSLAGKQGAEMLKADIMVVLAHPDDETGMASTLAWYALGQGKAITNIYATRGEGGGNMVGTHWGPALGILREAELRECLRTLGIRDHYFLDQLDWAYTESAAMTRQKWAWNEALGRLVRYVRALRPVVMLTMNPFPRPGQHGHHQAAGILAVEAFSAAADPSKYSEQLQKEGLGIWQPRKLYFRGSSAGPLAKIDGGRKLPDGRTAHEVAGQALSNHLSQGFGNFRRNNTLRPPEDFGLIKSVVLAEQEEQDFFQGLPALDSAKPIDHESPAVSMVTARFAARPAVASFLAWATDHKIQHLMGAIPSDLPVVMGQETPLRVELENPTNQPVTAELRFEGWPSRPTTAQISIPAKGKSQLTVAAITSPDSRTDGVIRLLGTAGAQMLRAETALHLVPLLSVRRVTVPPALDGTDLGWGTAAFTDITVEHRAEGKAESSADSSGRFRLVADQHYCYVDLLVRDQTLVSNIAPNDIRGHWRSDSVELCFDPLGGAEHTLGTYKIGIFPFDQAGHVRGARDADANQGPIEETAPETRLHSTRTSDGYRIQSRVPFSEIGLKSSQAGAMLGFNIIIYDGDKADAAPGENINESRLAWSPRPGVQGRPEDWGRIVLE